jgi:hypothetical protein
MQPVCASKGQAVLGPVAGATHIPVKKLQDMVSGEIVGQTNVLRITVANPDRGTAVAPAEPRGAITSTLHRLGVLQDELTTLDKRRFQQPDVSLLVPAYPLEEPLRPRLQALAVGALVGLFLTAGIALALLRPRAQHVDSGWG